MSAIDVPDWAWALLGVLLITFIAIDLLAHRGDGADTRRSALIWSGIWIAAALAFNAFVWVQFGAVAGEQFLAAYLLEKSLSVDNLFLFLVIFAQLKIPPSEQRRVLTLGILGALITRCLFIVLGAAAIQRWHEITYVFGALLVFTAVKLLRTKEDPDEVPRSLLWLERHLPWTRELDGHKFFTRVRGRLVATPLLIALVAIEATDVVFAIDSIPAAFAITREGFLIWMGNVFALLGLRALFVLVEGLIARFRYLDETIAVVLGVVGVKLLIEDWVHIGPVGSLAIIGVLFAIGIGASLWADRRDPEGRRERAEEKKAATTAGAGEPTAAPGRQAK